MAYGNYGKPDRRNPWRNAGGYRTAHPERGPWQTDDPTYDPDYPDRAARYEGPYFPGGPLGGRYSPAAFYPPRPYEDRYDRPEDYRRGRPGDHERGFFQRAGDEVASWFGDEEAEHRREMDHRGKGPRGYVRSDERIYEDVHDRLSDDPYIDASDIKVTVEEREVTLDGFVHDRHEKRRAEDLVDSVSGVAHVQNNLRMRPAGELEARH